MVMEPEVRVIESELYPKSECCEPPKYTRPLRAVTVCWYLPIR